MSWTGRARELLLQGYSEADAYAMVARERAEADAVAEPQATPDPLTTYREADGQPFDLEAA